MLQSIFAPLALLAAVTVLQEPPDPALELPEEELEIADVSSTMIGAMPRPLGRIRRVSWYHESEFSSVELPGWEKRATFDYDPRGRCVQAQEWTMGARDGLEWLEADPATDDERLVLRNHGPPSMVEYVRDVDGRPIAIQMTSLRANGSVDLATESRIFATWDRDSRGRVVRDWNPPTQGTPARCDREYWYDLSGRIRVVREGPADPERTRTQTFEYDDAGRVLARASRVEGLTQGPRWSFVPDLEPTFERSAYAYDSAGRLVQACRTVDGRLVSTSDFLYADDGKLAFESTWTFEEEGTPPVERASRTEEIYQGDDRPLVRRSWDGDGRLVGTTRWTYEDDTRGNWTRKTPYENWGGRDEVAVFRLIDYWD